MWACEEGHLEIVRYLIDQKAQVNVKDDVSYDDTLVF